MTTAISVENISKSYRLGAIGGGTLAGDLNRWWARLRGQPDPLLRIGQEDYGNRQDEYIWALHDVSFTVNQGEAIGIIGRNGAGKSTLLKILSRVTAPTSGIVKAKGRIASLLEVGTGFHPELTGRENIFLNGAIMGMSSAEVTRKLDEIVDFSGVEKFIDTPVKRYSSGMYVRLAFAVAAHLEPEILVVDEVLAVGDAEFQKKCLGKMGSVASEGRTVLFVSHNMSAVNRLCSRAILLNKGCIEASGGAQKITAVYLSGSGGDDGVRVWTMEDAPGVDGFKLAGVKLLNGNGRTVSVVDVKDDINIILEYKTHEPSLKFRCATVFYTQGIAAFTSIEPFENMHEKAGMYTSSVKIPAHLLAEGEYVVGISIFSSSAGKKHYAQVKDALVFSVYDSMTGMSARGDYAQNLNGVVRPKLEWKVAYQDS
jgi:lipopolysaccharide transport system ATP-binding protein